VLRLASFLRLNQPLPSPGGGFSQLLSRGRGRSKD
jgi:hypothetical protein